MFAESKAVKDSSESVCIRSAYNAIFKLYFIFHTQY